MSSTVRLSLPVQRIFAATNAEVPHVQQDSMECEARYAAHLASRCQSEEAQHVRTGDSCC